MDSLVRKRNGKHTYFSHYYGRMFTEGGTERRSKKNRVRPELHYYGTTVQKEVRAVHGELSSLFGNTKSVFYDHAR